jgi:Fe-S cluster assembly scaffold protein SufB
LFYLMTRGLTHESATKMIVDGFLETMINDFPTHLITKANRFLKI